MNRLQSERGSSAVKMSKERPITCSTTVRLSDPVIGPEWLKASPLKPLTSSKIRWQPRWKRKAKGRRPGLKASSRMQEALPTRQLLTLR